MTLHYTRGEMERLLPVTTHTAMASDWLALHAEVTRLREETERLRELIRRCEPFIAGLTRSHKSLKYDATRVYEQIQAVMRLEGQMTKRLAVNMPRVDPCGDVALAAHDEGYEHGRLAGLAVAQTETEQLRARYEELIMAVGTKYPGETRHQTALRYILQAETPDPRQQARTEG